MHRRVRIAGLCGLCLAAVGGIALGVAAVTKPAPRALDLNTVKMEIANAEFVTELEGQTSSYNAPDASEYRGVVLTVKVTKPAGTPLSIEAPDLSLHYYFGEDSDVVPCLGLSSFSTGLESDRAMALFNRGYGKTETQKYSTNAGTVYFDAFFTGLEPNVNDIYLFVGKPVTSRHTEGWTP